MSRDIASSSTFVEQLAIAPRACAGCGAAEGTATVITLRRGNKPSLKLAVTVALREVRLADFPPRPFCQGCRREAELIGHRLRVRGLALLRG